MLTKSDIFEKKLNLGKMKELEKKRFIEKAKDLKKQNVAMFFGITISNVHFIENFHDGRID